VSSPQNIFNMFEFTCNFCALLQDQPKIYGSFNVTGDKNKSSSAMGAIPRGEKPDVSFKERLELTNDWHRLYNGQEDTVSKREELDIRSRHEFSDKGYKARNGREGTVLKKDGHDISFQGRQEFVDDKHDAWNWKGDATPKSVRSRSSSRGKGLECIDDGSSLLVERILALKVTMQDLYFTESRNLLLVVEDCSRRAMVKNHWLVIIMPFNIILQT